MAGVGWGLGGGEVDLLPYTMRGSYGIKEVQQGSWG